MSDPNGQLPKELGADVRWQNFDTFGLASLIALAGAIVFIASFMGLGAGGVSGVRRWEGLVWGFVYVVFFYPVIPLGALIGLFGLLKSSIDRKPRRLSVWGFSINTSLSVLPFWGVLDPGSIQWSVVFLFGVFLAISWVTMLEINSPKEGLIKSLQPNYDGIGRAPTSV